MTRRDDSRIIRIVHPNLFRIGCIQRRDTDDAWRLPISRCIVTANHQKKPWSFLRGRRVRFSSIFNILPPGNRGMRMAADRFRAEDAGRKSVGKVGVSEKQRFDDWPERYDHWFETPVGKAVLKYETELILELLRQDR
jgi:hypothetical protein